MPPAPPAANRRLTAGPLRAAQLSYNKKLKTAVSDVRVMRSALGGLNAPLAIGACLNKDNRNAKNMMGACATPTPHLHPLATLSLHLPFLTSVRLDAAGSALRGSPSGSDNPSCHREYAVHCRVQRSATR